MEDHDYKIKCSSKTLQNRCCKRYVSGKNKFCYSHKNTIASKCKQKKEKKKRTKKREEKKKVILEEEKKINIEQKEKKIISHPPFELKYENENGLNNFLQKNKLS